MGIDDADQLHVVRLAGALARRLELQDVQVEALEQRPLDEGHVLMFSAGWSFRPGR